MGKRKRVFLKGILVDGLGTPLIMIFSLLVTPIYFKYIDTEQYGIWTTAYDFINLLALLNAGINIQITQIISSRDQIYIKENLNSILYYQLFVIFILILISISGFTIMPAFSSRIISHEIRSIFIITLIISLVIATINNWLNSVLFSDNRIALSNIFSHTNKIMCQFIPIIFLLLGFEILSFSYSHLLANIIIVLLSYLVLKKYLKKRIKLFYFKFENFKRNLFFSFKMFLGSTSYYIVNFSDTIIIANFLSSHHVTIYVLTVKLSQVFRFVVAKILNATFPSTTQMMLEGNYKRLKELTIKFYKLALRLGLFFCVMIICFNEIFVKLWVGNDKYGGWTLTLFAALICLKESIYPVFTNIIYATKDIKIINIILFLETILNIILSIALIGKFGINGVALSTVISNCIISFFYAIWKASSLIKLEIYQYLIPTITVLLKSLPSLALLSVLYFYLNIESTWMKMAISIAFSFLINILMFEVMLIFKYRNLTLKDIINKIVYEI